MNLMDFKAGEYVDQYEYKSFQPATINHAWIISDPELAVLLGEANRAIGELNAFSQLIPNIDFFIRMYVAKEATQSSRIEGTRTNIEEAFLDKADINPEAQDDWGEVQNYIRAINWAINQLDQIPLSNRLLRDTHAILMQGVRGKNKMPGEFRTSQNWIGVSLKNAVFVPPYHSTVPELMSDLEKFIHNEDIQVPHLIKAAIAHYQFETIHPFLDGNGRLGRLMISLYMASFGLLEKPALYLSDFFERNKTAYIDHLMAVRDANHMRAWIKFFVLGVATTAETAKNQFKKILEMKAFYEGEVLPKFGSRRYENARHLMQILYGTPVIDVKTATHILGTTTATANTLVADFVKYGILTEITGQRRNRLFIFENYLALFRST